MSAEFSTYGANAVLDGTVMPATLYVKAHTGNPGSAGTNNAAAETTRQSFTRTAASGGATTSVANLIWTNVATAETWTYWSAWDAASGGNCWMVGSFVAGIALLIGENAQVNAGDFDLSVTVWT